MSESILKKKLSVQELIGVVVVLAGLLLVILETAVLAFPWLGLVTLIIGVFIFRSTFSYVNKKIKLLLKNPVIVLAVVTLLIFSGWFYWFQYRPSQIRSDCAASALARIELRKGEISIESAQDLYNLYYNQCLGSMGLSK